METTLTNANCVTFLDTKEISDVIWSHPRWWQEIKIRQDHPGSYQKDTETIFLRGPKTFSPECVYDSLSAVNYPHFMDCYDALKPILKAMNRLTRVSMYGRMMVVRLKEGGHIPSHTDDGKYAGHFSRFHIPLKTNHDCYLEVKHEEIHMGVGELWWFNHRVPHSAHNDGDTDRIHLIIDAATEKYPVRG